MKKTDLPSQSISPAGVSGGLCPENGSLQFLVIQCTGVYPDLLKAADRESDTVLIINIVILLT